MKKILSMTLVLVLTAALGCASFAGISEGSHIIEKGNWDHEGTITLFGISEGSH